MRPYINAPVRSAIFATIFGHIVLNPPKRPQGEPLDLPGLLTYRLGECVEDIVTIPASPLP